MKRVRFSKAGPRQCKWIEGKPKKDPLCCAKPVAQFSSWCDAHHKRVFAQDKNHAKAKMEFYAKNGGIPSRG